MEDQTHDAPLQLEHKVKVKATLGLGTESFSVNGRSTGSLSQQLVVMKEESMSILKNFITKHNVPIDVPDEPVESASEDDEIAAFNKPPKKSKKQK